MIPDWLQPTFTLLPAALWMFFGMGIPWALVILPLEDCRDRKTVIFTAMALGPALLSLIMFIIGTFSTFQATTVLITSGIAAAVGGVIAFRRLIGTSAAEKKSAEARWTMIDLALLTAIGVAIVLRFWNTAYWPFATYDEFWVYGYNARIFMLDRVIPATMGYYPQNIPLAYTFMQLMQGAINDHAARVVLPWLATAGIGLAYLLGARLVNRRVGLLTAAIWALYPHHAVWSQFGDLEVPVTLYFTATILFFALAWRTRSLRYSVLAGLMMGAALWTKPTAGALIQSVCLIAVVMVVFWRKQIKQFPFQVIVVTLVAAFPMGGMWYIRNVLYGLQPLVLPEGYWQEAAQRSGQEMGWLLLIAVAVVIRLLVQRKRGVWLGFAGAALMLIGSLPSAFGGRLPMQGELGAALVGQIVQSIQPMRLGLVEYGMIAVGSVLLLLALREAWRNRERAQMVMIVGLFIAPYFVTWFWSYSYHFRLSFAIVPALIFLLAAELEQIGASVAAGWTRPHVMRLAMVVLVITLALPGWYAVLSGLDPALARSLPDDDAKYAYGNPALMNLVVFLRAQKAAFNRPMRIIAPNELRLGFFFPSDDIRGNEYPTQLDQLKDVDFYIDNSAGQKIYIARNIYLNQIIFSRTRLEAMHRVFTTDDGNFRFSVYTISNAARFEKPKPNGVLNVQIGDFATLYGYDLSTLALDAGGNVYLTFWWGAIKPAAQNYSVFIHLWDAKNQKLIDSWGGQPVSGGFSVWDKVPGAHESVPYPTVLWQTGETIRDEWKHPVNPDAPSGTYELRAGLFDPISGKRLPVMKDGKVVGDSVFLGNFQVTARN